MPSPPDEDGTYDPEHLGQLQRAAREELYRRLLGSAGGRQVDRPRHPSSVHEVERFISDLDEQIDAVCQRLGKTRVAIFGQPDVLLLPRKRPGTSPPRWEAADAALASATPELEQGDLVRRPEADRKPARADAARYEQHAVLLLEDAAGVARTEARWRHSVAHER